MKRETIYRKAILAIIAALCFILPNASAQNMDKGLHLIDMNQFHNAVGIFKELTKQTPSNADAWYYLGYCYSNNENADSAMIAFNAGAVADPKNPSNFAGQAMVQHLKNNDVQAKATLLAASKMNQKKYPNGLVSVLQTYDLNKYPVDDFIEGVYNKAQQNNPKNPNIYLEWGKILYNAKQYGPASASYFRAISNDEKNVLAHYLLGQMYNAARNFPAGLTEIDACLELDPAFVPAIREKGDVFYNQNKFEEAATWYAKYIQLTEETSYTMTRYAVVLYYAKKYDKAYEIFTKILKLEPNNPVILRYMGYVSDAMYNDGEGVKVNKDQDGISAMSKFFQIRKDSASNVFPKDLETYARLLKRTGQDSLAIVYFKKTLAADSSNIAKNREFVENIGELYLNQKKYVESARYLERAQQFRKGIDGKIQYKIAGNYLAAAKLLPAADSVLKKEYYVKADSAYSRVCQSTPNKPVGYYSRAHLANLLDPDGSKSLAKPYYEKTLEIALVDKPEENKSVIVESYQYLASQYGPAFNDAIKAKDKAKQAQVKAQIMDILNKILAIDPTNVYALENMKSLNPPKKPAGATK